jgi:crossover junction endodeoxyribonuclease RuvC
MTDPRVVIGVDPGLAATGYGLVREHPDGSLEYLGHGVIKTSSQENDPQRLLSLYQELKRVVEQHRPDSCAVEKLFMQRNVKTAIRVGEGRGAALVALASADLPLREYTPSEIKQAVVGYGNADKNQVQEMVKLLLNMQELPRPDDAADALAVAICHIHTNTRRLLREDG